jgi:tRNA pseudouridine32 synthase/23S rRNA pseudouridine746 synthase
MGPRLQAGLNTDTDAPALPTRAGVGASCVGLPVGPWHHTLDFLVQRFPAIPCEQWIGRMQRGEVVDANGKSVAPDQLYPGPGRLYYYRSIEDEPAIPFTEDILFRDEHLLVVDKPHFLPVTPGGRYLNETLLVRLKQQLGIDALQPLHRIDRETAGLVLFSLQGRDRAAYHALFSERTVSKEYEAVAPYDPALSLPLMRESRVEPGEPFFLTREVPGTPNAQTHVALTETTGPWARYALKPVTGYRHQLRVHMAALGLPIRHDAFYPQITRGADEADDHARPLQLLARAIAFTDPITGQQRRFESARKLLPLPTE